VKQRTRRRAMAHKPWFPSIKGIMSRFVPSTIRPINDGFVFFAQPDPDLADPVWVRLHRLPKEVRRLQEEFWTPRMRWLAARSQARYSARPEGAAVEAMMRRAIAQGEIGQYEGFRFVESPAV
jgi:hypothetical protein